MSFPSNPANYFTSPNDVVEFRYKKVPGAIPFVVYVNEGGVIIMSGLVYAVDIAHVQSLLFDLAKFSAECLKKYKESTKDNRYHAMAEWDDRKVQVTAQVVSLWPAIPEGYKVIVQEAPMDQFYKVGWASNDKF